MTLPKWNPYDYTSNFDHMIFQGPKINDPLYAKASDVNKYVEQIVREIDLCIKNEASLSAAVMCVILIEYISSYYSGQPSSNASFVDFMNNYFPEKYLDFNLLIYKHLRLGLIQNMYSMNPWDSNDMPINITTKPQSHLEKHIEPNGEKRVILSLPYFREDIYRAWIMYAYHLVEHEEEYPDHRENFHKRYNKVGGRGSVFVLRD